MTPTTDELRALVERLEAPKATFINRAQTIHPTLHEAAVMLRLWIAEREREADAFKPSVMTHSKSGYSEILLEDCPAYTGKRIEAQLLFRMSDRAVIGAAFRAEDAHYDTR